MRGAYVKYEEIELEEFILYIDGEYEDTFQSEKQALDYWDNVIHSVCDDECPRGYRIEKVTRSALVPVLDVDATYAMHCD